MRESKTDLKEKFIELRAAGLSYAEIAIQLNVSKPTLLSWGKSLQKEIANARTLRMDELFERFIVAKSKRIEVFGKRLESILAELDRRDLAEVKADSLLALVLKYGEMLRHEYEPLTIKGNESPGFEMKEFAFTESWPV